MGHHFNSKAGKQKIQYDNFERAQLECDKYNSRKENLGKIIRVPYLCKICNKFHITNDYHKKKITFNIQDKSKKRIKDVLSNLVLVKRINL